MDEGSPRAASGRVYGGGKGELSMVKDVNIGIRKVEAKTLELEA